MRLSDGIISGILAVIAALSFFYVITGVLERQNREIMETEKEQRKINERMDYLENRIKTTDRTIIEHWKRYGKG